MATVLRLLSIFFHQVLFITANAQGLKIGYYKNSCPLVETIVQKVTASFISRAPTLAAPLLRLHFHDCFVRGCDGSVLLNSTPRNKAEKNGSANLSLRGFQVVDAAKAAVEKECPGVVSCADILALVARDAVNMLEKRVFWQVPTGRRDGRVSLASETSNLPSPDGDIAQLKSIFLSKGLSTKDLVVLSEKVNSIIYQAEARTESWDDNYIGGHTIGTSHCSSIGNRLYNFNYTGKVDPTLDPNYVVKLKMKCQPNDNYTIAEMDPGSFKTFDEHYYTLVSKRRGLFHSDAALLDDKETSSYVKLQAVTHGSTFFKDFGVSMVKMGNIGVLTGKAGEIRKKCAFVN